MRKGWVLDNTPATNEGYDALAADEVFASRQDAIDAGNELVKDPNVVFEEECDHWRYPPDEVTSGTIWEDDGEDVIMSVLEVKVHDRPFPRVARGLRRLSRCRASYRTYRTTTKSFRYGGFRLIGRDVTAKRSGRGGGCSSTPERATRTAYRYLSRWATTRVRTRGFRVVCRSLK